MTREKQKKQRNQVRQKHVVVLLCASKAKHTYVKANIQCSCVRSNVRST